MGHVASMLLKHQAAPTAAKRFVWKTANRNFLHHDVRMIGLDMRGNKLVCNTRDIVQKHIALFGVWEPALTAYLLSKPPTEGLFLDVGANIGYFSLLASTVFSRVIAFEA